MHSTRDELRTCIAADMEMQGLPPRWRFRYRVTRGVVYFQWLLRRAEYWETRAESRLAARPIAALLKVRLRRQSERLGFDIPRGVCGPGLSIAHSGLLVIS